MLSSVEQISSYVDALRPIIYINHFDFQAVDRLIEGAAGKRIGIEEYNEADKHIDFNTKAPRNDYDLCSFLSVFDTNEERHKFLVLKDVHHRMDDPEVIARLKSIALKTMYNDSFYVTVFIVNSKLIIPGELSKMITVIDFPLPDYDSILDIIESYANDFELKIDEDVQNELIALLRGLSDFEIRQILNLAYQQSGSIDQKDAELILKEKEQVIRKSGLLELVAFDSDLSMVGGLSNLKVYLQRKAQIFKDLGRARKFGVDLPKGILVVGMPGCGKSLTAKTTANLFKLPLLRLDVGKLMGKYVGESEENLRKAIQVAEAVAPCVLWIDELEKAFAGVGGDGASSEITTRLFGYFLTWMQEKENSVYVVATSNDTSKLPSEFLRKGRFDELFRVNLPNSDERKSIFEIHLRKRGKLTREIDIIQLIKITEGYSGADLEAVVKEAIEQSFLFEEKKFSTDLFIEIIRETKPFSVTFKNKIDQMEKNLADVDCKPASK